MSKVSIVLALIAACGLLVVSACSGGSSGAAEVIAVAAAGETAPGLEDGYLFESFDGQHTIGASGELAFAATANIKNGSARDRKSVLWFGRPDELRPVATVGQIIPGLESETRIGSFQSTPQVITESGRLGFIVSTATSARNVSSQALLMHHNGKIVKVVAAGEKVPMQEEEETLLHISAFAMSDAGIFFMGKVARNQSGLWFWDYSDLTLVGADRLQIELGANPCVVRSVASTSLDVNRDGLSVFRLSLGGNQCPGGGLIAWDADSNSLLPIALNRTPIAEGSELFYQSVTGDARVSDDGQVSLHANVYDNSSGGAGAREMTLLQQVAGGASQALINKTAALIEAPDVTLTHTIVGDGMAVVSAEEVVHFVRSNRDRIILRTLIDDGEVSHTVIARAGTVVADLPAARIGNGHVNRNGDVVFTSFIDDGPKGGTYQQELWFAERGGSLKRLAFIGQSLVGRTDETIERIEFSNQSYEPTMNNTQGGRSRLMDDSGATLFAGRLRKGSQWHNALFLASPAGF